MGLFFCFHPTTLNQSRRPLRGGKTNNFEGGIRVVAFVTSPLIPSTMCGKTLNGYVHIADFYPTLCLLGGGLDCYERNALAVLRGEVPGVDGLDMFPYLTGQTPISPRTEIMVASCTAGSLGGDYPCTGALISGQYKLIVGKQSYG